MDNPPRVLHVISGIAPSDGGPTTALVALARALSRLQAEVTLVATPKSSGPIAAVEELRDSGVRVRLGENRRRILAQNTGLDCLLQEEISRADVVHIHALWEGVQYRAARISGLLGKPFIVRPCGLLDPWSMARHRVKKHLYLNFHLRRYLDAASGIHYSTTYEEERCRALQLKPPPIVEANGFDFDEYRNLPLNGSFRDQWDIPRNAPVVLFLGRLHSKKGLDLLIPAFAEGAPSDGILVIAGSGKVGYERTLRQSVASLGLANRVRFTGFLDGQARTAAMADATVFALPSYSENFANTVVESIAAGTPVVVSDQVGLHLDVASSGVGGVVPTSVKALSAEIECWLRDASKRELAIANADRFLQLYDLKRIAARWLERYRALGQFIDGAAA